VKQAASSGDAAATYRALVAWREAAAIPAEMLAALPSVLALERALFGPAPRQAAASTQSVVADLEGLRSKRGAPRGPAPGALPPLNPPLARV
jgi:hypothetical protein